MWSLLVGCLLASPAGIQAIEYPSGCSLPNGGLGNTSVGGINFTFPQAHVGDTVTVVPSLGMVAGACQAINATGSVWVATGRLTNFLMNVTLVPGVLITCPPGGMCQPGPYSLLITPALVGAAVSSPNGSIPGMSKAVRAVENGTGTVETGTPTELLAAFHTATIGIVTPCVQVVASCSTNAAGTNCTAQFAGYVTNCGDIRLTNVLIGLGRSGSLLDTNGALLVSPLTLDPGRVVGFQAIFTPTPEEFLAGTATTPVVVSGRDTTTIQGTNASVAGSTTALCNIHPCLAIMTQPQSRTNAGGTDATFSVTAAGTPPFAYQWRKGGTNLLDAGNLSGTFTPTLTVSNVQSGDAGAYDVLVTNNYGSVTSSVATLTVVFPPTISSQPQSRTNDVGTAAALSVTAAGAAPLAYQWRKNGLNVSAQTNATLLLTNVQVIDSGDYDVVVTNNYGSITSQVATLSVYDNEPFPAFTATPTQVACGRSVFFDPSASTHGRPDRSIVKYEWDFNYDGTNFGTALTLASRVAVNYTMQGLGTHTVALRVTDNNAPPKTAIATNLVEVEPINFGEGTVYQPWVFTGSGPNGTVVAMAHYIDGRIVIGGTFADINGVTFNRVALVYPEDGSPDYYGFLYGLAAANATVRAVAAQSDGKVLIAGEFTSVNGVTRNRVARLNSDGSLDTAFQNGLAGANDAVYSLALQSDGKILIGGAFTQVNSTSRGFVARLNTNGSLDTTFPNGLAGADNTVISVALQSDGKVLIGGAFANVNGSSRKCIARLNSNGSLDTGFQNGMAGANGYVYSILAQGDGTVLMGGDFTTVNGTTRPRLARLNSNGNLDTGFGTSAGANGIVWTLAQQWDGGILAGGDFTTINGTTRNRIALLNADGSANTDFNPGMGANSTVYSILPQPYPDGTVLAGGSFTNFNGVLRSRIARLQGNNNHFPQALAGGPYTILAGAALNLDASQSTDPDAGCGDSIANYLWDLNNDGVFGDVVGVNPSVSYSALIGFGLHIGTNTVRLRVTDGFGLSATNATTVIINDPVHLTSQPQSRTNVAGSDAVFSVTATGTSPLAYQWRKNSQNLTDTGNISGSISPTLVISNVYADAGDYDVIVTNGYGGVTSAVATLTVWYPPTIATQPSNQTNLVGDNATFTVSAIGYVSGLHFEWRRYGTNFFDGGTYPGTASPTENSLLLTNVQLSDTASYDVVITNSHGAVTSVVATLTVLASPSIVNPPQDLTLTNGSSGSMSVVASGTAPLSYQWRFNATNLPAATGSSLGFSNVNTSQAGPYQVVVTNIAGSVTSSVATLTVQAPITSLLTNGSFETGANPPVNGYRSLSGADTSIDGWVVSSGRVDWSGIPWNPEDGSLSAQLVGNGSAISQTFAGAAGQGYYQINFFLQAAEYVSAPATVDVTLGGSLYHAVIPPGPAFTWYSYSTMLSSTSTMPTLTFTSVDGVHVGPFVDNVSVFSANPASGRPAASFAGASTTVGHSGNSSTSLGWTFTANGNLRVSGLGYFDDGTNGLYEVHEVGIFNDGGQLLVSATIPAGTNGTLIGPFRYVAISPLILPAGTYTIGGTIGANATDPVTYTVSGLASVPEITIPPSPSRYTESGTYTELTLPDQTYNPAYIYFGPNFLLDAIVAPTLSIQPPSAGASSISMGFSGSPGSTWNLERAPSIAGPWTNIGSLTIGTNGVGQFQDTNPPAGAGFYRARQP